ncbi:DUF4097 family beta strand repeat-containing protein [Hymenobacter rubripertinctus]|uniref:Adhesin domain-containing protein n=1 Tax=Hymenobacter rubripertinctus TaxID=2029981 RepID=A0A418QU57_9BACT|nr:DUF4097 domain-containing protein [Hymenobacter rubripertinctus]RIY08777.1 hypothetical protein D0T11_13655 [Hymenobacter rubripertinctus]
MSRFLLALCALICFRLLAAPGAAAQRVITKTAPVGAGQTVVLDLKYGTTIRLRPATDNQLRLRATVSINQNKLNDALELDLRETPAAVTVMATLDKQALAQARPNDCPASGPGITYYGSWTDGRDGAGSRAGVCATIDYEITLPANATVRLNTISGNVDVAGLTGPLTLRTISGFVDVTWPTAHGAEVAFKSVSGEVYTDQDIAFVNQQPNPIVGYQLKGTLGNSGPAVRLESVSGSVFFRKGTR